ncbi:MAG TPA: PRC-barrel domain-containing protein [Burkholderiales bacterium]|nr:PRC-barrel domain-containing protein [Burkholderiales bacterium]
MRFLLALALAVVASASYAAQPLSRTVQKWQDLRASELIGMTAVDRQGEKLGRIRDLILGTQTGHVHYVVVTFGGLLGLGDRQYLYPVQALAPGPARDQIAIQVDRKDLGERTGVDELESWLRQYDPNANYADRRFIQASELIGKPVNDRDGERTGEIEDLVVNLGTGELRHVVVELREARRSAGSRVAFPLHALAIPILRDEPLRLRSAAG